MGPADDTQNSKGLGWQKAATKPCVNDLQGLIRTRNSNRPGSMSFKTACAIKGKKDAVEMVRTHLDLRNDMECQNKALFGSYVVKWCPQGKREGMGDQPGV